MEISANAAVNAALQQQQAQTQQGVQVAVLKKAMDVQSEGAMKLIESLPSAPSTQGLPANLGNNINVTA
ncbi:MAG: YjfB family protein [Hydrogenovibrio sp.]